MRTIVVGCGKIGTAVIRVLVKEGHDVIAIDNNEAVLQQISNLFDVMTLCGNGADSDVLNEAETKDADLFIALTGVDELNMLSCFLAQRMGVKHTMARIRNPEYNDRSLRFLKHSLDLSVSLNPEMLIAQEIFNLLKFPAAINIETFSRRNFEMIELRLPADSSLEGMTLREMREKYNGKYLICVVQRENETVIPGGDFVLRSGDKIGITAMPSEILKLFKTLGLFKKKAKSVMILGGGRPTYYLAKMLSNIGIPSKIIEKDLDRCAVLSTLLPDSTILHGDGAEQEVLIEEGLRETDAFVALTGMDEENILLSILANMQNVPQVIPKINREELIALADRLGLQTVISPLRITTNIVLRYARAIENSKGSNIETLYKLMDGSAEAIEFKISPTSGTIGIPLKDLSIKKNILIAGILRGRETIIPSGNDVIMPDDRVVVLSADSALLDIDEILVK